MSRIGNSIIKIPEGVTLDFTNGLLTTKGKLGELSLNIDSNINIDISEQEIKLTRKGDSNEIKSMHGLTRALIFNMVTGVSEGFTKKIRTNWCRIQSIKSGTVIGYFRWFFS